GRRARRPRAGGAGDPGARPRLTGSAVGPSPRVYAGGVGPDRLQERLSAYLGDRLGLGGPVPVTGLVRLAGGSSRETWAFAAEVGGRTLPLVLRRDPPGRSSARPCSGELDLLRAAAAAGVPVPVPRWGES